MSGKVIGVNLSGVTSVNGQTGAVQIGGRNYAKNSAFKYGLTDWKQQNSLETFELVTEDEKAWVHIRGGGGLQATANGALQDFIDIPNTGVYTLSANVRGAAEDQHVYFYLRVGKADKTAINTLRKGFTVGTETQRISQTFEVPVSQRKNIHDCHIVFAVCCTNAGSSALLPDDTGTNDVYVTDVKLEVGNTPTDWSPSPFDYEYNAIPTASATVPKGPGTAAAGSETGYARGDHVHPRQIAEKTLLYNNMSLNGALASTNVTMDHPYTYYDVIYIALYGSFPSGAGYISTDSILTDGLVVDAMYMAAYSGTTWVYMTQKSNNTFNLFTSNTGSNKINGLKIWGIKL